MPLSDDQFELLETYLDGELTTGEEDALRQRMSSEPELAQTLAALRSERETRLAIWKSCEPDGAAVARVVAHVEQQVDRHNAWAYRMSRLRVPLAAAACILIGFSVGWLGRGSPAPNPGTPGDALIAQGGTPAAGNITTVGNRGPVELPIVDEYGRVVATQRFATPEEAARFIEDCSAWQQREEKIKDGGNIVPVGSEKF
jgi:anti-sigma factor RsiW